MTNISIIVALVFGILLLAAGIWEAVAWVSWGPVQNHDPEADAWLDGDLHLVHYQKKVIYRKPNPRNPIPFYDSIHFIREHRPTLFSKYYVHKTGGGYRILKGSELHKKIQSKHLQLLGEQTR